MKILNRPMIHELYDRINVTISFQKIYKDEIPKIFELSVDKEYDFKITEQKKKRSLDANAYAWLLIGRLAERLKLTITEVYKEQIKELPTYTIICLKTEAKDSFAAKWEKSGLGWICEEFPSKLEGCTNIKAHYGSSEFNTKEMSLFIDNLIQECNIHRIPIDRQEIYDALERWK